MGAMDRINKVHETPAVLVRFVAYRDVVKAKVKALVLAGVGTVHRRTELRCFHCSLPA